MINNRQLLVQLIALIVIIVIIIIIKVLNKLSSLRLLFPQLCDEHLRDIYIDFDFTITKLVYLLTIASNI